VHKPETIIEMKSNNTEEFLHIFESNKGLILKIVLAYTHNQSDREDLINDIALELWKSYPAFKGEARISTWIYRVALNTSMNFARKKKKDGIILPSESMKHEITDPPVFDHTYEDEYDVLYNCIEELNDINKAIILLYLDGNSHEEIAEITGISKTNVGTRVSRIKEQLKQIAISKN
jgi:RNA polymerase sigma-70 factor, ECF subfamily